MSKVYNEPEPRCEKCCSRLEGFLTLFEGWQVNHMNQNCSIERVSEYKIALELSAKNYVDISEFDYDFDVLETLNDVLCFFDLDQKVEKNNDGGFIMTITYSKESK